MGYIIEITEDTVENLAEHLGKVVKHSKKAMEFIEKIYEKEGMGERSGYGNREDDDDDYDDDDMGERGGYGRRGSMGQRRGVRGTGRYSRYR